MVYEMRVDHPFLRMDGRVRRRHTRGARRRPRPVVN
jgi:hypothetical protein